MTDFTNKMVDFVDQIVYILDIYAKRKSTRLDFPRPNWKDLIWSESLIHKAHLSVVDERDQKGLYMMHLCIFPAFNIDYPIFGLDVIAGRKKITGFFMSMTPTGKTQSEFFSKKMKTLDIPKPRELPTWAKEVFSDTLIASGNIQDEKHLEELCSLALEQIENYFSDQKYKGSSLDFYNFYCRKQKENEHTPRTLKALGLLDHEISDYIEGSLFKEEVK